MNLLQRLSQRFRPTPVGVRAPRSAAGTFSARPTYATSFSGQTILPRDISFQLLEQYYNAVPLLGRAIDVLSGFVGCPCFEYDSEAATEEMRDWCERVPHGYVGYGLRSFIKDHLTQAILYGYGVGEIEASPRRDELARLWTFKSPAFGFRADSAGVIEIVQQQGIGGLQVLNPETTLLTVHNPQGADPNGRSMFFASHSFCQGWLDIAHAFRSTWRRNGIPIYHVNWRSPEGFSDPNGNEGASVRDDLASAWNSAMKSQAVDGKAEDFYSTGEVTVTVIGADGNIIDVTISKRAMVEEVVTATGLPAWMYGYAWSTTERLSTQQADMILATVDCLRYAVSPTLLRIATLRQRLAGRRDALQPRIIWPDINLQDRLQTAQAAKADAEAQLTRQKYAERNWQLGYWSQGQAAEHTTGSPEVDMPMDEPPGMQPEEAESEPESEEPEEDDPADEGERAMGRATRKLASLESRDAYPGWRYACNGKH